MPSAAAMVRSRGVLTKPRTRSALAPTYTVVTVTEALSLRGYCRTVNVLTACRPAIRMTRLITMASTGRRMNRSVKDFMCVGPALDARLAVGRPGRFRRFRDHSVFLDYGHARAQLELA